MFIMVLFFGFATVICWGHYGMECVGYLSSRRVWRRIFTAVYAVAVLIGAVSAPARTWEIADLALGLMTLINLAVICPMSGEVIQATKEYLKSMKARF